MQMRRRIATLPITLQTIIQTMTPQNVPGYSTCRLVVPAWGVFTLLSLESVSFENNMLHSFRRPAER